jgi:hypothetical protein
VIYYHGSSKPLKIDSTLVARARRTEFGRRKSRDGVYVEEYSDAIAKKLGVPPRSNCLFMVCDRRCLNMLGASEDYVYEVQPNDDVFKLNFSWFQALMEVADDEGLIGNDKAYKFARNYLEGTPIGTNFPPYVYKDQYEFVTLSFTIVDKVKPQDYVRGVKC